MADKVHTVRSGETLAAIARRYKVATYDLQAANRLSRPAIRPGQELTIPDRGVVYVRSGDNLHAIAERERVDVETLRQHNRLKKTATLRIGQRLELPGYSAKAVKKWGRPDRPGVIEFQNARSRKTTKVRVLDKRGRVRSAARRQLTDLMRPKKLNRNLRRLRPNPRLLKVLAQVSDHFGGKPLTVISGFREAKRYTKESSRHTQGRALDFRIRGVPNTAVRDYCRSLGDVGVGFYPNSTFIHLDVRDKPAYWVDWSKPGQRPVYRKPGEGPPSDDNNDGDSDGEIIDEALLDDILADVAASEADPTP